MHASKRHSGLRVGTILFLAVALFAPAAHAIIVRTAVMTRPVARAAVATAAVVGTATMVGSMVNTLPPQCAPVVVGNVPYQHCGNAWYQPQYAGSQVTYVVVNPPAQPH